MGLQALRDLGYKTISASMTGAWKMQFDGVSNPAQLPTGAETALEDPEATVGWKNNVKNIMAKCEQLPIETPCVVMMHPQEFSDGFKNHIEVELSELDNLIGQVIGAGWTITTFS